MFARTMATPKHIQKDCKAYLEGDPSKLPIQPKKKERRKEDKIYYVLVCKDKIHLVQRPKTGLLSGLYGFDEKSIKCKSLKLVKSKK